MNHEPHSEGFTEIGYDEMASINGGGALDGIDLANWQPGSILSSFGVSQWQPGSILNALGVQLQLGSWFSKLGLGDGSLVAILQNLIKNFNV